MIRTLRVLGALSAALAGAGCTGAIDSSGAPGIAGTNGPGSTGPGGSSTGSGSGPGNTDPMNNPGLKPPTTDTTVGMLDDKDTKPGSAPLRRLTIFEYRNTVRDLLGAEVDVALIRDSSDQDSANSGFLRGGALTTPQDARNFANSADKIATDVQGKLASLLPCSPIPTGAAEQEACAGQFVTKFGLRAFRRPVAKPEADRLMELYKGLRGAEVGASFERAVTMMISAVLQSPAFLYHWELGPNKPITEGGFVRFNGYEIASRLSYLLWGSMPDDKLFAAAADGKLASPEQISTEARRLLADPRSIDAIANFHSQWLEIEAVEDMPKNPEFKDFDKDVARSMALETKKFVESIFMGPKATGKIETLFTATHTFVDPKLAKIYGLAMSGDGMKEVTLDPAQRAGIFTQGSFLVTKADADDSHPVKRGDTLLKRVLCTELTPPPGDQVPAVADSSPDKTTRQRYAEHSTNGACAACHTMIDPLGFAFENYNAIGAYRAMENGKQVDATGTFKLKGGDIKFNNAVELVGHLAKAPETQDCMVRQWLRYGLRRHENATDEAPSVAALAQTFKAKNFDMRELLVAVTKTRSFTHRALSPGEVAQ